MAARAKSLRAVAADERPEPVKALTLEEAIEAGDQRAILVAMRARVATAVKDPNCPARDLAALTRRLQELTRDIEAVDARVAQEADEDAGSPDEEWDESAI